MKKSLVIFDLDGTLLYTVPDIAAATNQALAACGYPVHSEAEIASYIGNGINKLFERALPEASRSQEEVLRIRSLFLPYPLRAYRNSCRISAARASRSPSPRTNTTPRPSGSCGISFLKYLSVPYSERGRGYPASRSR